MLIIRLFTSSIGSRKLIAHDQRVRIDLLLGGLLIALLVLALRLLFLDNCLLRARRRFHCRHRLFLSLRR